jgi:hypothetical protein
MYEDWVGIIHGLSVFPAEDLQLKRAFLTANVLQLKRSCETERGCPI